MIASLPMYDWPHTHAAHEALWTLIRDGLRDRSIAAPDSLNRDLHHMVGWAHPDLVLGQICNLPYRAQFQGKVTRIGAADYGLPGAQPGYYYAVFVVRADDPAQRPEDCAAHRFAYNERLSNSGYGAAQLWAAARGFQFDPVLHTHAHRASVEAVASGAADLATIDAHTWGMMRASGDAAPAGLRVIGHTDASPGMTFITRAGQDPAPYASALRDAIAALPADHRRTLGLRGIVDLPDAAYDFPLPPNLVAGTPDPAVV